jgi:diguanylate cyclase (GGDEF)-like protein/PAS domain S-box-containing protein
MKQPSHPVSTTATSSEQLTSVDHASMLDNLFNNLDGMVYRQLNDENWTMQFASGGCLKLTGYTAEELIFAKKVSYTQLILPEYLSKMRTDLEAYLLESNRFEFEYPIKHKSGDIVWVLERGMAILDSAQNIVAFEGFVEDITQRRKIAESLKQAEMRYRSIFEHAIEGIFQTSLTGQYLVVNPALANIYGYSSPEDLMQALNNIEQQLYVSPQRRDEFIQAMHCEGYVKNFESLVYRKDKSIIWISENARMVHGDNAEVLYYEGTVEDITERKNYAHKMEHQATHDSLTGLPNRHLLNDRLQNYINFAERYKSRLAVAFLDLDQFKFINDSMGHEVGDQLLVVMAERLKSCVREIDTVVRLGGDEFVILLTNIHARSDITQTMERVLHAVSQPCALNNMDFVVSCSIGISVYPKDGKKPNTLLKNADSALYKAKHAGRNNFQLYSKELSHHLTDRVKMEYQLRVALEQHEFLLHYQPKLDLKTDRICGAEALLRWQPTEGAMISPLKFIAIAEETGLIEQIGSWVLMTACKKAQSLQELYGESIPISINVSPKQFHQAAFVSTVKNVLAVTGVNPNCVELEITENCLIEDTSRFIETLYGLKNLGVKLSIDDFGTGYSSMAYLKDFPIDTLKIDKVFISRIHEPDSAAILNAMVVLGKSLNLSVVAEGVETEQEYAYVKKINCDMLQGYYFSKPLADAEFAKLLKIKA